MGVGPLEKIGNSSGRIATPEEIAQSLRYRHHNGNHTLRRTVPWWTEPEVSVRPFRSVGADTMVACTAAWSGRVTVNIKVPLSAATRMGHDDWSALIVSELANRNTWPCSLCATPASSPTLRGKCDLCHSSMKELW